jgi:hypothetical protein
MANMEERTENYKSADEIYFAAKAPEDVASVALDRAASFFNLLRANAYLEKLQRMWRAYHGAYDNDLGFGHRINFTGEQGELVSLPVNHFRNIAQHIFTMITANRPIMEARAINTDYKSLAQVTVANSVLDYYMREKHLERAIKDATEMSIVLGSGFVKLEWNATAGEAYDIDPETGEFNYEGEIEFSNLSPFDVVVDGTKETWDNDWILTRSFKNRYDLMAKYPEMADKIKGLPPKNQSAVYRLAVFSNDETDDIPVYEFFHKKTESMPEGRYILFLDADIVLLDAPMPYRVIPVFRIVPSTIMGTPYGYTPMFDVFPIQEGINSLYSTIMTNQNAFGVQNLFVPRDADIAIASLQAGMNIIEGNSKPEPINFTQTPAEVFKFLEMLIQTAETISGVNSVTRGNPEASLKSGAALALVQSMSLQFVSGLQQSYVKLIEDVGTALVNILKDFAKTPKVIALVGKNNLSKLHEFTGEQIGAINRVVVDIGNPLSRTIAGRVQMAEQLLQMNLIKNPQQYFQVMNTGRLDSMYEGEQNELLLMKAENERLMDGQVVHASALDAHRMHIMEHKAVLADPDLRKDNSLVEKVMAHITEHIDLLRNTDPDLLALIGEQPLPPPQQPMAPTPTGQSIPQQGGQAPARTLERSPMESMIGPEQAQQIATAPGQVENLPNMPRPPAPFENAPVSPQEMLPG